MSLSDLLSWLITAVVVATLLGFVLYAFGLRALPTDNRPTTPIYDRLGREIGETENPDYRVNPGEDPPEDAPSVHLQNDSPPGARNPQP